jgi:hypothetical protein
MSKKMTKQDLQNYIISEATKLYKTEVLKEEIEKNKYTDGKHLINVDAEVKMDREAYKKKIYKREHGNTDRESLKFIEEVALSNPNQNSVYSHVSYAICEYIDLIGRSSIIAIYFED